MLHRICVHFTSGLAALKHSLLHQTVKLTETFQNVYLSKI